MRHSKKIYQLWFTDPLENQDLDTLRVELVADTPKGRETVEQAKARPDFFQVVEDGAGVKCELNSYDNLPWRMTEDMLVYELSPARPQSLADRHFAPENPHTDVVLSRLLEEESDDAAIRVLLGARALWRATRKDRGANEVAALDTALTWEFG